MNVCGDERVPDISAKRMECGKACDYLRSQEECYRYLSSLCELCDVI